MTALEDQQKWLT